MGHKDYIDQFVPENLQSALNEFSTAKGKEKPSWTNETAKEKLEVVGKRYGAGVNGFLSFAFFNIYRDVSEIIHGSYYGMRIFLGMQNKDITAFKSSDEAADYLLLIKINWPPLSYNKLIFPSIRSSKSCARNLIL